MKRSLPLALCLLTLACGDDPAKSVKIVPRPAAPALIVPKVSGGVVSSHTTTSRAPDPGWVREFCPPPADDAEGPSTLAVTGPCGFTHRQAVKCESLLDDFIIGFVRNLRNGATMAVYFNVENYRGPGSYSETQMFAAVQSGTAIYRWSNDYAHATVGPGEAYLEIPPTRLDPEPMLINCTALIGPSTNYQYQCGGRTAMAAIESAPEIVSGTLGCENLPTKQP